MGLLSGREWPWSVFVNDLRIISEIIETPAEFLLFLERRLSVNDHPAISTFDEIDYLAMFLKEGLYFEKADLAGLGRFSPIGYTVPLERYYDRLGGRVSTGDKPRLNISDWYRTFTRNVEFCGFKGALRAAMTLLAMDGSRQQELEQWYRQYQADTANNSAPHSITLVGKNGPSFVVLLTPATGAQAIASAREYARMKRLQTRCETLLFVALDALEPKPLDLQILDGELEETPALKGAVTNFSSARVRDHMSRVGTPARNAPCPCNSGRKYKKCCYLAM